MGDAPAVTVEEAKKLLEAAQFSKSLAETPVSGFHVGAAAKDDQGHVYLGFNVEFPGTNLSETIHAEHSCVATTRSFSPQNMPKLVALAVTAKPCGHCRQMLIERFPDITVIMNPLQGAKSDDPQILRLREDLIPNPVMFELFENPRAESLSQGKAAISDVETTSPISPEIIAQALEAMDTADGSFSGFPCAVLFLSGDGVVMASGACMESIAFNPTQSAFQTAYMALAASALPLRWSQTDVVNFQATDLRKHFATIKNSVKQIVLVQYKDALVTEEASIRNCARRIFNPECVVDVISVPPPPESSAVSAEDFAANHV